jgi:hypothetical protein
MKIFWWILIIIIGLAISISLLALLGMKGWAASIKNMNSAENRKARLDSIKSIIGFDFGINYIEIENQTRFHPDRPIKVILEFDEPSYGEILNFIENHSLEKTWVWGKDRVTLRNPEGDIIKGNYFVERIDLIFTSKRLEYHYSGC